MANVSPAAWTYGNPQKIQDLAMEKWMKMGYISLKKDGIALAVEARSRSGAIFHGYGVRPPMSWDMASAPATYLLELELIRRSVARPTD